MIPISKDKLANDLRIFRQAHGINPVYFATVVGILISLSYYKDLKNWENVVPAKKWIIVPALIGTAVLSFMSILGLLGIANY